MRYSGGFLIPVDTNPDHDNIKDKAEWQKCTTKVKVKDF